MPRRRRSSAGLGMVGTVLAMLAILLVGGGGTIAAVAYLGLLDRPVAKGPSRAGKVPMPVLVRPVKAYQKITREDVYDLAKGDDSYYWLDAKLVEQRPEWVRNAGDIIGRVMARDKEAGYVFQEKDFLPEGTREGVVGGIPRDKRAMVVPAEKIQGLRLLSKGDQFDLFATLPISAAGDSIPEISVLASEEDTLTGGTRTPESRAANIQNRLGVKLLVRGGILVDVAERPGTARAATRSGAAKPADLDVSIAVSPEEIISLTHALSVNYNVFCAARSGLPEAKEVEAPEHPLVKGMIAVPIRARPINPLSPITRDSLLDPSTGQLSVLYFKPDQLDPSWLTDVDQLVDRVAARELHAGLPFRDSDFLPQGTRAGVSGGTPPDKMSISIAREKVQGLADLRQGDRFDLLATLPVDLRRQFPQLRLGQGVQGYGELMGNLQNQASISVLVKDGAVVANVPDQPTVTIAVAPSEISGLTKALVSNVPIYSVVRSGHAEADGDANIETPADPLAGIAVIEKINGATRAVEVFATQLPASVTSSTHDADVGRESLP